MADLAVGLTLGSTAFEVGLRDGVASLAVERDDVDGAVEVTVSPPVEACHRERCSMGFARFFAAQLVCGSIPRCAAPSSALGPCGVT